MINIALPKGRFLNKSVEIISKFSGITQEEIALSRRLFFKTKHYNFFLLKSSDICNLVFNKKIDLGIVPDEWIIEHELKRNVSFNKLRNFDWINTKISLFSTAGNEINTEFGARGGNRTHVIGLEGRDNSHYTTRASKLCFQS